MDPYRDAYAWITGFDTIAEAQWRYVTVTFQRNTPVGTVEDLAQIGFNIVNHTAGLVDNSWDDSDRAIVEGHIRAFIAAWQTYGGDTHTAHEIRFYVKGFNPDLPIGSPVTTNDPATGKPYKRFINSGSVEKVYPLNLVGGSAAVTFPYQSAMSVTWRTAQRLHWGRIYLPGVAGGAATTYGRFTSGAVSYFANAAAELVDALNDQEFLLVVPTTQAGGKFHLALQSVTEVVVDDVPDVIRRRRPKQPLLRQVGVPT